MVHDLTQACVVALFEHLSYQEMLDKLVRMATFDD